MVVGEKIVLGFSGGVDSLAAARLLQEEGFEVVPLLLEMGGAGDAELQSRAEQAASRLGLGLLVENLSRLFTAEVVDYLKNSYARTETPNPCLRCNARVKFAGLALVADRLGIEKLATGHYFQARPEMPAPALEAKRIYCRARDRAKDQSYFLSLVPEKFLARSRFPLADRTKDEIFTLAAGVGYRLENYRESQELCFLNGENYRDFLSRSGIRGSGTGEIVTRFGRVVGRHAGLENYTVGQRRGLDIAWSEPLYVLELDMDGNRLVVGPRDQTMSRSCIVADLNWLTSAPAAELDLECQIRYRHRPAPARLIPLETDLVRVEFTEPQFALTPGQGAAFYRGERLLGGGFIQSGKSSS